ncbi:hypothetical protein [Amycolatopsis sp. NPDC051716]|uniref:hypothetical protein n=1 Tax=Amycolatopsis sp. NPDC051716 TaxID=3155804 RepID=UPI0034343853
MDVMTYVLGVLAAFGVPLLIVVVVEWWNAETPPSEISTEIEAMESAARIRSMTNAAEDHMDVFIQERRRAATGEPITDSLDEWERPW